MMRIHLARTCPCQDITSEERNECRMSKATGHSSRNCYNNTDYKKNLKKYSHGNTTCKDDSQFISLVSMHKSCWSAYCVTFLFILTVYFTLASAVPSNQHTRGQFASSGFSRHIAHSRRGHQKQPRTYLNQFAVNLINGDEAVAIALARKYGFVFKGQIGTLEGWYLFEDKKVHKRSLKVHHKPSSSHRLENDPHVFIVEQQVVLKRTKRSIPNDPAWTKMWYMHCGGVNNSVCPTSMRISDAWRSGYHGDGVVVTILDDGIETNHPDLWQNYDANASYDINSLDNDPMPRYDHSNENKHGTRCAGVVAAVSDNGICSVGIASKAKIGGIRMLDGEVTDNVEAQSLGYNHNYIDIYSASWGPDDDGVTIEGPGFLAMAAFKEGARKGRNGKGSIFVWASGNGGHNKDTCSCDGYINSIYTIGISSVSQNGKRPWYLESCASTLATTYSSGEIDEGKIITTDLRRQCTYAHTGTSASAPMAAGVIALMLDANKNLTWRDVQHIIVQTSNPYGLQAHDWVMNGAGYNVSHVFGFGLMDAAKLTHVSKNWTTVPEQKQCPVSPIGRNDGVHSINNSQTLQLSVETRACHGKANEIEYLEHVVLRISLSHVRRGDLQIFLTSPAGTRSNILERRNLDRSTVGFDEWNFMTTHHWGENPQGVWVLEIFDSYYRHRDNNIKNQLLKWQMVFYGTKTHPQPNFYYNSCDAFPQDQCHRECNGCCGPTEQECRACKHVSTFTGTCIPACPHHQFPHPYTRICQPCWKTCRECSAAYEYNCTACADGFALFEGRCMKQCAKGFFLDHVTQRCLICHESCFTCEERRDKCTSCRPGFEHQGYSCEPSCPAGTFLLSYESGCSFCHPSCLECTGQSQQQCTACGDKMVLHKRRCIEYCPKKHYIDESKSKPSCKLCHQSCKSCDGPLSTNCLSCNADYVLLNGECRRICRDGWRYKLDRWNDIIQRRKRNTVCPQFCEKCQSDICTKCIPGKYLMNGTCVDYNECGLGKFSSDLTNSCEECRETCINCDSMDDCLLCEDEYFEYAGSCLEMCPDMTYVQRGTNQCRSCFHTCESCTSFGVNACTKCGIGYYLYGNKCRSRCPNLKDIFPDDERRICINITRVRTNHFTTDSEMFTLNSTSLDEHSSFWAPGKNSTPSHFTTDSGMFTLNSTSPGEHSPSWASGKNSTAAVLVLLCISLFVIGLAVGIFVRIKFKRRFPKYQALPLNELPHPRYDEN
ncbi:proprotein convertase subtilisin/kexin type 6-like isoform X2 [Styela clava]